MPLMPQVNPLGELARRTGTGRDTSIASALTPVRTLEVRNGAATMVRPQMHPPATRAAQARAPEPQMAIGALHNQLLIN